MRQQAPPRDAAQEALEGELVDELNADRSAADQRKQMTEVRYQIQRAVAAAEQIKDACAKIDLPYTPGAAIAAEALELLRANTRSVQMLLLVISLSDSKRRGAL
jgi:hypothetical protein